MNRALLVFVPLLILCGNTLAQEEHAHEHDHDSHMSAEDEAYADSAFESHRQESMLMWTFNSLGWRYSLGLPFFGLLSFVLSLALVIRGGQYAGPSLVFVVSMPFLLGVFGVVDGLIASYSVIANSASAPKPSEIASGVSTALVSAMVGMLMMAPSFLVAAAGLFIRAMMGAKQSGKSST